MLKRWAYVFILAGAALLALGADAGAQEAFDELAFDENAFDVNAFDLAEESEPPPPSGGVSPDLHYLFADELTITGVPGPTLTVSRSTARTCVNATPVIVSLAANEPCFDHDPVTGDPFGLLIENTRTNITPVSSDFDSASWVPNANAVVTDAAAVSPTGATDAQEIAASSAGGTGQVQTQWTLNPFTASTVYAMSVYFKAAGANYGQLRIGSMGSLTIHQNFDLTTCTATATTGANVTSSGTQQYANDWCRAWIIFTSDATDTNAAVLIRVQENDDTLAQDLDGVASVYAYGFQLEVGSFPSSLINTTGSATARNADNISTTTVDWFNQNGPGTLYVRGYGRGAGFCDDSTNACRIADISSQSLVERVGPYRGANGDIFGIIRAGNTAQGSMEVTPVADVLPFRMALGWDIDDLALYVNGSGNADTSATALPDGVTELQVGASYNLTQLGWLHVAELAYWVERRTDEDLDGLSDGTVPVVSPSTNTRRLLFVGPQISVE